MAGRISSSNIIIIAVLLLAYQAFFAHHSISSKMRSSSALADYSQDMNTPALESSQTSINRNKINDKNIDYTKGKQEEASCFRANPKFVITQNNNGQPHTLPTPIINLGFPKIGTNSINEVFKLSGYTAKHNICGIKPFGFCSICMLDALQKNKPPLASCGDFQVWSQIDFSGPSGQCFWPQIRMLNEFHAESPNATFLLTFRNIDKWISSLTNWRGKNNNMPFSLRERLTNCTLGYDFTAGVGTEDDDFSEFFCDHVKRVRQFVADHPSHALVEIDIEDPLVGKKLEAWFDVKADYWGHQNISPLKKKMSS